MDLNDVSVDIVSIKKDCSEECEASESLVKTIENLPDEVLMLIFNYTSQYQDYSSIKNVCWRWNNVLREVSWRQNRLFRQAISNGALAWRYHEQPVGMTTVTERYSHSACYYDRSIYVFGGCASSSTTFNDLWRFDLALQIWIRPLASGSYPSPKACASFLAYNDSLVLFGGWTHPTNQSFFAKAKFFNQLHLYHPHSSKWTRIDEDPLGAVPSERAGHGASIIQHNMIVIGGYSGNVTSAASVDVWALDLKRMRWSDRTGTGPLPPSRYGHSQAVLSEGHIAVVGGCGGPNRMLADAWLLSFSVNKEESWMWVELKVVNQENSVPPLVSHPACQVGDKLVVLSKNSKVTRTVIPKINRTSPRNALVCCNQSSTSSSAASQSGSSLQTGNQSGCCDTCTGMKRCYAGTDTSDSSSDNDDSGLLRRAALYEQRRNVSRQRREGRADAAEQKNCVNGVVTDREPRLLEEEDNQNKTATSAAAATSVENVGAESLEEFVPKLKLAGSVSEKSVILVVSEELVEVTTNGQPGINGCSINCDSETSSSSHIHVTNGNVQNNPSDLYATSSHTDVQPKPSSERDKSDNRSLSRSDLEGSLIPRMQSVSLPPRIVQVQRSSAAKNRQKQLEALRVQEERLALRNGRVGPPNPPARAPPNHPAMAAFAVDSDTQSTSRSGSLTSHVCCHRGQCSRLSSRPRLPPLNPMFIHRLDLSRAVTEATVAWLPVEAGPDVEGEDPPDETMFYSLIEGRGELVMFGGIQGDMTSMQKTLNQTKSATRHLYYIQPHDIT